MYWSFEPDGARARALATEIDRRLIDSLRYLFGEIGADLDCPPERSDRWIAGLESGGRIDPLAHTLFHTIAAEVQADNADAARALATRLFTLGGAAREFGIRPADPGASGARPIALFGRFVDLEQENRLDLEAPDPATLPAVTALIEEGLALIARNDPGLDAELRAFVVDLVLVGQAEGHRFTTAAISCFQNWGALIFNPTPQRDSLDVVEVLAHEATHLQLFGLALDEPLLTNAPEERYHSPLRDAPRTMDGVFHATIVAGRVARALLCQAHASNEKRELRETALDRAARSTRQFDEGVAIVEAHAMLTPLGRRVLDDSKAAVDELRERMLSLA